MRSSGRRAALWRSRSTSLRSRTGWQGRTDNQAPSGRDVDVHMALDGSGLAPPLDGLRSGATRAGRRRRRPELAGPERDVYGNITFKSLWTVTSHVIHRSGAVRAGRRRRRHARTPCRPEVHRRFTVASPVRVTSDRSSYSQAVRARRRGDRHGLTPCRHDVNGIAGRRPCRRDVAEADRRAERDHSASRSTRRGDSRSPRPRPEKPAS